MFIGGYGIYRFSPCFIHWRCRSVVVNDLYTVMLITCFAVGCHNHEKERGGWCFIMISSSRVMSLFYIERLSDKTIKRAVLQLSNRNHCCIVFISSQPTWYKQYFTHFAIFTTLFMRSAHWTGITITQCVNYCLCHAGRRKMETLQQWLTL